MKPSRVALQIKEALVPNKGSSNKADLDLLSEKFSNLKHKIKRLVEALKAQHLSLVRINDTRVLVSERVAALAEDSPISEQAGYIVESDLAPDPEDFSSYYMVHQNLSHHQKKYTESFLEHIVEYALNWEKVVVARVSASLKTAEKLRIELDHYTKKVESIQMSMVKGKTGDKNQEKLSRNTTKLANSKKDYEDYFADLTLLIEEVTTRGWKDLHPILLKMVQFDINLAYDENEILSNLSLLDESLRSVAITTGLRPESRLKDLETLSTKLIGDLAVDNNGGAAKDEQYSFSNISPQKVLHSRTTGRESAQDVPSKAMHQMAISDDEDDSDKQSSNDSVENPFDEATDEAEQSKIGKKDWYKAYANASAPPQSPNRPRSNFTSQESLYGGSVTSNNSTYREEDIEVESELVGDVKRQNPFAS